MVIITVEEHIEYLQGLNYLSNVEIIKIQNNLIMIANYASGVVLKPYKS